MATEFDRFMSDMKTDTKMQEEARDVFDLDQLAAFATSHGYAMSGDELRSYDAAKSELSDAELDSVAGGFSLVTSSVLYN